MSVSTLYDDLGLPSHLGERLTTYAAARVRDLCDGLGLPYQTIIPEHWGIAYEPNYETKFGLGKPVDALLPEAILAEIPDCEVVGGFEVVLKDDVAGMDLLFRPGAERYYVPSPPWGPDRGDQTTVDIETSDGPSIESGILLQSWFAPNYYHWALEHLTKLLLVQNVPPEIPLLVDRCSMEHPPLRDMLASLTGRSVIRLQHRTKYAVGRLFFPSALCLPPMQMGWGSMMQAGDICLQRLGVKYLRRHWSSQPPGKRRFFIHRTTGPMRLVNIAEVTQVFAEFGFEIVQPEYLSFAAQRKMFGGAQIIAGETGAGLTNMLLAPPSAKMICLQSQTWAGTPYADMTASIGQESIFVVGDLTSEDRGQHAPFSMDPVKLRSILGGALS